MKALILAAGKSTRIAGHVGGLPKPLIPVAGEPIIAHTLRWLASHSITHCWVNLHYQPEPIREMLGDGSRYGVQIRYVHEPHILGTAGAVKNLEAQWDKEFLVVYGDNYLGFDLAALLVEHRRNQAVATVALFDWDSDQHSGIAGGRVIMAPEGRITGFAEKGDGVLDSGSKWVNAGAYCLQPAICRLIPSGLFCDFGRDIFPRMLQENIALAGFPIHSYCLAVDTVEALTKANQIVHAMGRHT